MAKGQTQIAFTITILTDEYPPAALDVLGQIGQFAAALRESADTLFDQHLTSVCDFKDGFEVKTDVDFMDDPMDSLKLVYDIEKKIEDVPAATEILELKE